MLKDSVAAQEQIAIYPSLQRFMRHMTALTAAATR
jgi:hypothetical protein